MSARRVLAALALLPAAAAARAQAPPPAPPAPLTAIEVPAAGDGHVLALLVSGDGGWASADRAMAEGLARRGVAVVGLDSRAYLRARGRVAPEEVSRDAATLVERYGARWHRDRVLLLGYSRGADLAPFVVSRWPDSLRRRLALVTLVGLAPRASFEFHWRDLVHDTARPNDLPVRPELERLRGTPILCLYGEDERDSLCPALDPSLAHVERHAGRHALDADSGAAVAERVLAELR